MATKYVVTAVTDCEECNGTGIVEHPAWVKLSRVYTHTEFMRLTDSDIVRWFHDEGYDDLPPEEMACVECEGAKQIEHRVDLSQALAGSYRELEMRVDELEERVAELAARLDVLEMDRVAPGMTPAQYVALRADWGAR